jgi:hypothetical protein
MGIPKSTPGTIPSTHRNRRKELRTIPSPPDRFSDHQRQRKVLFPAPHLQLDRAVPFKVRPRQKPVACPIERVPIYCFQDIARVYTSLVHRPAREHAGDFEQTGLRDPPSARRPPELLPRIEQESEYEYDRCYTHPPRSARFKHMVTLACSVARIITRVFVG